MQGVKMQLYELLGKIPMFENITEQEIKQVAKVKFSDLTFQKDDVIIKEGEDDASLYLLIVGTVSIIKGDGNITIAILNPGDVFGDMSFLTRNPRYTTAKANEDVRVLKMDDNFFQKIDSKIRDKIKDYFIELLISRLDRVNEAISHTVALAHRVSVSISFH